MVSPPSHATSTPSPRAKNSTGGFGFAYSANGSSASWLPTETTLAKRHGKLSTGMLCADATSIVRLKYAASASSWSRSTYCFFVVDRLMLTTGKPCSIAHSSPASRTPALPVYPAPRTRTLVSSQSGASERMIPAHAVP